MEILESPSSNPTEAGRSFWIGFLMVLLSPNTNTQQLPPKIQKSLYGFVLLCERYYCHLFVFFCCCFFCWIGIFQNKKTGLKWPMNDQIRRGRHTGTHDQGSEVRAHRVRSLIGKNKIFISCSILCSWQYVWSLLCSCVYQQGAARSRPLPSAPHPAPVWPRVVASYRPATWWQADVEKSGGDPSLPRGRSPRHCGSPRCRHGATACLRSLLRPVRKAMRRRNGKSSAAGLRYCSCGPALDRCSPGQNRVGRGLMGCQSCLRKKNGRWEGR